MTQYFLALQTPTVELTVTGSDPSGKQSSILVGFKRYELEEAQARLDAFSEANKIMDDLSKLEADGVEVDKSTWREASSQVREAVNEMLKEEIVYFRNVQLWEQVPNRPGDYKKGILITDSRTFKEEAVLNGKTCLDFLLDMHVASSLWRNALVSSMISSISNIKLGKEAEAKN